MEGLESVIQHWPALGLVCVLMFCVYHGLRALALAYEHVGNLLGPLGRFWRRRRTISRAEIDDLQRRIAYLDGQVRALRYRDEVYFAFTVYDQAYHHRQELLAAQHGWHLEPHTTFLEFRDNWMKEHGLENEALDIWQ